MLPKFHKMWEIVEEHRFSQELATIIKDPIRADVFIDGAKGVLSRDPEAGTKIGERIWFLPMAFSNVVLYYWFDDAQVHFESLQRVPNLEDDEDDEGE